MSNFVQGLVWNAEIPNPHAKLVAVKLADHADDDGGSIFPAVDTVAQMTALSRSTVCKWQFAFEHCGLLKVVDRSGGGKGNTTERAFDIELLKRIVWTKKEKKKIPPECMLVEATIERETLNKKTGKRKTVTVTVLEIVRFAAAADTVRQTDGCYLRNRPADGRATVRQTDSNRPPDGHEPSSIPQGEPSTPLPPEGECDPADCTLHPGAAPKVLANGRDGIDLACRTGRGQFEAKAANEAGSPTEAAGTPYVAPSIIAQIATYGCDPTELIHRAMTQIAKGTKIGDLPGYLIRSAQNAAKQRPTAGTTKAHAPVIPPELPPAKERSRLSRMLQLDGLEPSTIEAEWCRARMERETTADYATFVHRKREQARRPAAA